MKLWIFSDLWHTELHKSFDEKNMLLWNCTDLQQSGLFCLFSVFPQEWLYRVLFTNTFSIPDWKWFANILYTVCCNKSCFCLFIIAPPWKIHKNTTQPLPLFPTTPPLTNYTNECVGFGWDFFATTTIPSTQVLMLLLAAQELSSIGRHGSHSRHGTGEYHCCTVQHYQRQTVFKKHRYKAQW